MLGPKADTFVMCVHAFLSSRSRVFVRLDCNLQEAIEDAEKGDFSGVRRVLRLLEAPFDPPTDADGGKDFLRATPDWAADLVCTCSS